MLCADGRVDLYGSAGPFTFVKHDDQGGWYYVSEYPLLDEPRLDGELFRGMVRDCLYE